MSGYSKAKARLDAAMLALARAELGDDAEIPPWRLHDLRRTAASGLAKLGVAPHVVERILNHTSGTIKGVAAIYNRHDYAAEKRMALDAWAREVERVVSGATANVLPMRARG